MEEILAAYYVTLCQMGVKVSNIDGEDGTVLFTVPKTSELMAKREYKISMGPNVPYDEELVPLEGELLLQICDTIFKRLEGRPRGEIRDEHWTIGMAEAARLRAMPVPADPIFGEEQENNFNVKEVLNNVNM